VTATIDRRSSSSDENSSEIEERVDLNMLAAKSREFKKFPLSLQQKLSFA
jgi:hypothetical protein